MLIANTFHFEKATYFEVNDAEVRRAPDVSFGEISYRGDAPQVARPDAPGQVGASDPNALPNPQQQPYPQQQSIPQQGPGYTPPQA